MAFTEYFKTGGLLAARLAAAFADASIKCAVLRAAGWEDVVNRSQLAPAVFVWHQGDRIPQAENASRGKGRQQIVDQVWNAVVAQRNVKGVDGATAETEAEAMIAVLLDTIQGIKPAMDRFEAKRVQSQYATSYRDGVGYYPFAFAIRIYT